jgi:oligoribonuclease NrnB/cAMP/cGMP phosphodiesterase (DHH superfamily)
MDLIIYHNNCPDGWAAAYICKLKYPEAELVPLNHGLNTKQLNDLHEKVSGKNVIMVDYSLPTRDMNDALYGEAAYGGGSLRIYDHHKTAQAVLEGADYAIFDMKRSGAGLAWDYLFGEIKCEIFEDDKPTGRFIEAADALPRPWWVNYVEDQDLWNWALPHSQEINAYLMVQPRTVEAWDKIIEMNETAATVLGVGVRQYIEYYTRSVLAESQEGIFWGYKTGVVNMPYAGVSEVGAALVETKGYEIGLAWFERGDGITQFSMRSHKGGPVDVSAIAKMYGGGGHPSAAGFQVSIENGRSIVDQILDRFDVNKTLDALVVGIKVEDTREQR